MLGRYELRAVEACARGPLHVRIVRYDFHVRGEAIFRAVDIGWLTCDDADVLTITDKGRRALDGMRRRDAFEAKIAAREGAA